MEQEFSRISKFPEKRTTSRGELKFSKRISGNFLFHSILNRNLRKFWSNGTRPSLSATYSKSFSLYFQFLGEPCRQQQKLVFASVRNSHRTLQLAVAKHSFLSKCRFTIFREHNNSFHLITLFTRCKHRHQYYIGIVQIFEPLPLFSKSMKLPRCFTHP